MKILIVDDSSTSRKFLTKTLTEINFENITEAVDGKNAQDMLKANKFDLIISDWNMPVMNGLEFLIAVRNNPEVADIPFIMLTAEQQKENILTAVRNKVTQYILKPYTAESLKEKIEKENFYIRRNWSFTSCSRPDSYSWGK